MKRRVIDLIDFEKVNVLLEGFNKTTGFVTAILDLEGNVLSKSGWRHICTQFHRIHPGTSNKCKISDTELAGKLAAGENYHSYKCLNGLIDVAIPIIIKGEHIANLFTGQFFFENPDYSFFQKQAIKYGFDEEKYLEALEKVPVVSQSEVKTAMEFLLNMTELIVEMTYQQLEQKELNQAIKESENHYRQLYNHMLEAVAYHQVIFENGKASDYIYLKVNESFEKHTGQKNVVGKKGSEVFPITHKNNPELLERIERVALTGKSEQYETYISESDTWYFITLYSIEKDIVISIFSNITERKKAEEQKAEIYKRFERISSNVPGAIYEFCMRPDGTSYIPYASSGIKKIFEVTPEEVKTDASKIFNLIHPDDREIFFNSISESAKKLESWYNENRIILSSGKIIWVEGTSTPHKLEDGSILWYGYMNDITNRKLSEIELLENKSFFEQLFIQSSTSTQLLDKEGWCIRINPKLSELFGVLPEHIEGKKYNILKDDEIIRTGVIHHLKKVFENKETVHWEVNFDIQHASESTGVKVSKPEKRWFQNIAYPILNAQGELMYVIVQHEDITERKLAEFEIKKLNLELENRVEERTLELSNSQTALLNLVEDLNEKSLELDNNATLLEAKNKELETFTYSVSHDLKAPLRGIDGYSRLLEEYYSENLNNEGRQFIKTIREGTMQMNQLIEDLLAYSRLERSTLRPSSLNSVQFFDNILTFFKDDILKNKIKVEKDIPECQIIADSDGLTIAMRNIVENAIKFSSKGSNPKIKISLKENVSSWLLSVEDNGIGFNMKYSKRIFEIFQRLNLPEQYAGTGIGLAMVSKSVDRMGGKIWAESELGKGAKFYIQISKNNS